MKTFFTSKLKQTIAKITLASFVIFVAIAISAYSQEYAPKSPASMQNFFADRLANGLDVFVTEDGSAAITKIEFSVRAGFSAQTPVTAGFFPLYASLFSTVGKNAYYSKAANKNKKWLLSDMESVCSMDAARFTVYVAPENLENALEQIASCASAPFFADDEVTAFYSAMKEQISKNEKSTSNFINAAVYARIFKNAPWKHETGVFPEMFSSLSTAEVRSVLYEISSQFYAPQNSSLIISGQATKDNAYALALRSFGSWRRSFSIANVIDETSDVAASGSDVVGSGAGGGSVAVGGANATSNGTNAVGSSTKKFVLANSAFSPDILQVVVQYDLLDAETTDIMSAILSDNSSSFKTALVNEKKLAIRDASFIDVAAVHEKNCNRIVIQSILQNTSGIPSDHIETFIQILKNTNVTDAEKTRAQNFLTNKYNKEISNVENFSDALSKMWSVSDRKFVFSTQNIISHFIKREENISKDMGTIDAAIKKFNGKTPFVFVLVNSSIYAKNKAKFRSAGYEEVTTSNGTWYNQEQHKKIRSEIIGSIESRNTKVPIAKNFKNYASQNKNALTVTTLSNGTPIVIKKNDSSSTVALGIVIDGGFLLDEKQPMFTELMVNILAENIKNEIEKKQRDGKILCEPNLLTKTTVSKSIIMLECPANDKSQNSKSQIEECISCITDALIYGDVTVRMADKTITDLRRNMQMNEASLSRQLSRNAMHTLYDDASYSNYFGVTGRVLSKTSFTDILNAYPALLDASRYTIVVVGNCDAQSIKKMFDKSIGLLLSHSDKIASVRNTKINFSDSQNRTFSEPPKQIKNEKLSVKLVHRFMADANRDRNAPMPSVLVPTTNFSDPTQFWILSPQPASDEFAIFDALVHEIGERIKYIATEKYPASSARTEITRADGEIFAAAVTVYGVPTRSDAEKIYSAAVVSLLSDLSEKKDGAIAAIKSGWAVASLLETSTNIGTAELLIYSIERKNSYNTTDEAADVASQQDGNISRANKTTATRYLSDYETIYNADEERFLAVMKKYIPENAHLAVFSEATPE